MSFYSPVAPIDCLLKIQQVGFLGNYLLLLAHDVVANEDKYRQLISNFAGVVIMDNSLVELGEAVDTKTMLEACEITNANYAVLPDVLLDTDGTIEASTTAARQGFDSGLAICPTIVAQGKTIEDCVRCVADIAGELIVDTDFMISIPRALVDVVGTRSVLLETLYGIYGKAIPMHLLGFSSNYRDDIMCASMAGVTGIDSATPIRLGWQNKFVPSPADEINPADGLFDRGEFFKQCNSFNSYMAYNLGAVRGAINA